MKSRFIPSSLAVLAFFNSGASAYEKEKLQTHDEICAIADPALVKSVDIDLVPEFFFRPFAKSNYVALASDGKNYFVNLANGKYVQVPGQFDALPFPDEKYWIYPTGKEIHFNKMGHDRNGPVDQGEVFVDPQMQGYYQSIGLVKRADGSSAYRVILDNGGYLMQDYSVGEDQKFKPKFDAPKTICANLPGAQSLPMLSKDGRRISLLDVNEGRTKIYTINDDTGECTLERALSQATGKVDFSYDNRHITYHTVEKMDALADTNTKIGVHTTDPGKLWIRTPTAKMVANVWEMDLSTGVTKQISHFTESSALYPAFTSKGNIIVRKFKEGGGSTILNYNPKKEPRKIDSATFKLSSSCDTCTVTEKTQSASLASLGQLFSDMCVGDNQAFSPQSKAIFVMNLDAKSCKSLAASWTEKKHQVIKELKHFDTKGQLNVEDLEKLDLDDLLAACPQETLHGVHHDLKKTAAPVLKADIHKIPAPLNRCLTCHGADSALPIPFNDLNALKKALNQPSYKHPSLSLLVEMKNRVGNHLVPPPNELGAKQLTDSETNEVVEWLDKINSEQAKNPVKKSH